MPSSRWFFIRARIRKAIGFICRNQSQKGRKKTEFVNSVDEVERITGYDFFPQLPDDVEKRVEAKAEMF